MVKFIPHKRTSKSQTLDSLRKVKPIGKVIRHQYLEEKVDRRHRYKTTKQERAAIDINLMRRIDDIKIEQRTDAYGSYFKDLIELKRSAISPQIEKQFLFEAHVLSSSLPAILANLPQMVRLIKKFIPEQSCAGIVLDLAPFLIKDCREEFYIHFIDLMTYLTKHINIEDVNILEKVFLFIAYGVKYLEKQILGDFNNFMMLINEHYFMSKYNIVRRLSAEILGYFFRKNRSTINMAAQVVSEYRSYHADDTLAYAVYVAILGVNNCLQLNATKILDQVWSTQMEQLIIELYKLIIQRISYHSKAQGLWGQVEIFKDLERRSIKQPILYELLQKSVDKTVLQTIIDLIDEPQNIGYALIQEHIEECLSNTFIDKLVNKIDCQQLQQVVDIVLINPIRRPVVYKLLMAASFQQLFNQHREALLIILQLEDIHCMELLQPEQLDKFYNSEIFTDLLSSDAIQDILALTRISHVVEFPIDIQNILQQYFTRQLIRVNSEIDQTNREYSQQINRIEQLTKLEPLIISEQIELIVAEQQPNNSCQLDGLKIRLLEVITDKSLEEDFISRSNINYLFSRSNLQLLHYLQNYPQMPVKYLHIGLMSRKRQIRLQCAKMLNSQNESEMLTLMIEIDKDAIDLDNERYVKTQLVNLKALIGKCTAEELQLLDNFAYGISFTKFLLVRPQIKELLSAVMAKHSILKLFVLNYEVSQPQMQLDFIDRYCYMQSDDEPLDEKTCFEEVIAPSLLHAHLNMQSKILLMDISVNYLTTRMELENSCTEVNQFYSRRFGDRLSTFYLKLMGNMLTKENALKCRPLLEHWLMKDNEGTQAIVLSNLQSLEILLNETDSHNVINEFFDSMKAMINSKTFRGELTRVQLELPPVLKDQFHKYIIIAMYPKIYSKIKLSRRNKGAGVQARRNAVFQLYSIMQVENIVIDLIAEQHGFNKNIDIPTQIIIEYMKIMKSVIDKFGFQMPIAQICRLADTCINILSKQKDNKELWKVTMKRLMQMISKFDQEEACGELILSKVSMAMELQPIQYGFSKIVEDSRYQPSGLLRLLSLIAQLDRYHPLMIKHHNLLLGRFYQLYEIEQTDKINVDELQGREAFEVKKQNIKVINSQKSVIREINNIMFSILQLPDPLEAKIGSMDVETSAIGQLFCDNYGSEALQYLLRHIELNQPNNNIIIKSVNVLFLFYSVLLYTQNVCQSTIKRALFLLIRTLGNNKTHKNANVAAKISEEQSKINKLKGKLVNNTIKQILLVLDSDLEEAAVKSLYQQYSQVLLQQSDLKSRISIVDVITTMASKFQNIYPLNEDIVVLLNGMNQRAKSLISEELNYDACLEACFKFQQLLVSLPLNPSNDRAIELVLQNCSYLITTQELSIRVAIQEIYKCYFQRQQSREYIDAYLLPQLIECMRSKEETTLKCSFHIFEHYLNSLTLDPELNSIINKEPINATTLEFNTHFGEFKYLFQHHSPDQNIFNLIFDIQIIKRFRALQMLQKRLQDLPPQLASSYSKILLPLLEFNIIHKGCEPGHARAKITDSNRSHYHTFQQLSIELYGQVCNQFSFDERVTILQKLTKQLTRDMCGNRPNPMLSIALIKLIGSIAKNKDTQYDVVKIVTERLSIGKESQLQTFLNSYQQQEIEEFDEMQDFEFSYRNLIAQEKQLAKARQTEQKDTSNQFWNKIVGVTTVEMSEWQERSQNLLKQVYHPLKSVYILQSKNKDPEQEKLRLQLCTALTQIIVQLPPDSFMTEFNRLVGRLCRALKSRDNDIREQSRRSLIELLKQVGPIFLKFVLTSLKITLTQGFENHVLSYTLGVLLEEVNGQVDGCLSDILEIMMDEVLGKVSDEKENENMPKKCKEIKSKKGMGNFRRLAELINFTDSLPALVALIDNYVSTQSVSHILISKLRLIFEHLYLGLIANPTLPQQQLVPILYLMLAETSHKVAEQLNKIHKLDFTIDGNLKKAFKRSKEDIMTIQLPSIGNNSIVHYMRENKLRTSSSLIFNQTTLLAIKLLNHQMRELQDSPLLQRMFKIILDCIGYADMMTDAVTVISGIIRGFSWVQSFKKQIINSAMSCISKLTSTDEQCVRDSFQLLRAVLDSSLNDFTASQQKSLVNYIDLYVEYQEPLECLKLIVHQKWALPQLYDLVVKVREFMLQNTRKYQLLCRQIYLAFLVKYPLSPQVLQSHLDFLMANLEYSHHTGRSAVYQCFMHIFDAFPLESVMKMADIAYLAIIVAYIKEDILKKELAQVIQQLIGRLPDDRALKLAKHSLVWMASPNEKVKIAGIESIRALYDRVHKQLSETILISIIELHSQCLSNWNDWKSNIQAQNIQRKNLKNSQWADALEIEDLGQHPEQAMIAQSLYLLLNQIEYKDLSLFFRGEMACNCFRFTCYPQQETANLAMQLILKSKTLVNIQSEQLAAIIHKMLKHYFLLKYIRNTLIINEEITFQFLHEYLLIVDESVKDAAMDALLRITKSLMSKQQSFNIALKDLICFYRYLLKNEYPCDARILESVLKIQTLQLDIVEIDEVLKLFETMYGSNEFAKLHSQTSTKFAQSKIIKRIEKTDLALNDPQQFNEIKRRKNIKKKTQKKIKLLTKRGKVPIL